MKDSNKKYIMKYNGLKKQINNITLGNSFFINALILIFLIIVFTTNDPEVDSINYRWIAIGLFILNLIMHTFLVN